MRTKTVLFCDIFVFALDCFCYLLQYADKSCVAMSSGQRAGLWKISNCTDQMKVICTTLKEGATPLPPVQTTPSTLPCPSEWKVIQ